MQYPGELHGKDVPIGANSQIAWTNVPIGKIPKSPRQILISHEEREAEKGMRYDDDRFNHSWTPMGCGSGYYWILKWAISLDTC